MLDGGLKALARIESGRFVMEHVFPGLSQGMQTVGRRHQFLSSIERALAGFDASKAPFALVLDGQ